jgi:aspartyl-tRNA(Asn)/glutamyl-tRNA(Gln) amidotransferase subunit B
MGEVLRVVKDRNISVTELPIPPAALGGLIRLVEQGTISSTVAKEVFGRMYDTGQTAEAIVAADGLAQVSDTGTLEPHVRAVVDEHPEVVSEIRAGKDRKLQFLVGQVMKRSRGKADPKVVTTLLKQVIDPPAAPSAPPG